MWLITGSNFIDCYTPMIEAAIEDHAVIGMWSNRRGVEDCIHRALAMRLHPSLPKAFCAISFRLNCRPEFIGYIREGVPDFYEGDTVPEEFKRAKVYFTDLARANAIRSGLLTYGLQLGGTMMVEERMNIMRISKEDRK